MSNINKLSMAVPLPEDLKRQMASEGVYVLLNKNPALPTMGVEAIRGIVDDLRETGANQFIQSLGDKACMELPYILKAGPENMVEIDGRSYLVANVRPSEEVKKARLIDGIQYQKGGHWPGEVVLMDENGSPVIRTFDEIGNSLRVSPRLRQESMDQINEEVTKWNDKVSAINKAVGITKLNLQVMSAEATITERLASLSGQEQHFSRIIQDPLSVSSGYGSWIEYLKNNYRTFSPRDIFDTLMFLYQYSPEQLLQKIESNEIEVPQEIRTVLMAVAAQEANLAESKREEKRLKDVSKQERKDAPLEQERLPQETPIRPVTLDDVPEKKFKEPTQYKTLHTWSSSLRKILEGIAEDKRDLTNVMSSFGGIKNYIKEMENGTRARSFLRTPEGQVILRDLESFLDAAQVFIKRYESEPIIEGKLNPKLMGRAGSIGNALIAVRLNNIFNIIQHDISEVKVPEAAPETVPTAAIPTEAKSKNKIEKMSERLWSAFENRMKI